MQEEAFVQRSTLISDPPGLVFTDLAPGDVIDRTVTVTNSSPYPVELTSHVTRDGALFRGAHPLAVSFEVTPAAADGICAGVENALPANATASVRVHAGFPAAAGNEYQSQTGTATLYFTATQLTPEQCGTVAGRPPAVADTPQRLPHTGIDTSGVVVLAVVLLVVGCLLHAAFARRDARKAQG